MNNHQSGEQTAHERLRVEIEQQIQEFLAQGGSIDCLASPAFEANKVVHVRGGIFIDH